MQKKYIEIAGHRYELRTEGCLYGLYAVHPDDTRITALKIAAAILLPALAGLAYLFHRAGVL